MAFPRMLPRLVSSIRLTDSPSAEIAMSHRLASDTDVDQSGVPSAAELVEYSFWSAAAMYNADPSGLNTIAVASTSQKSSKSGNFVLDLHQACSVATEMTTMSPLLVGKLRARFDTSIYFQSRRGRASRQEKALESDSTWATAKIHLCSGEDGCATASRTFSVV